MSGIAEVLHNLGYLVSGSDQAASPTLTRLAAMGVLTHVGHSASNVKGAQVVVTSSAIQLLNPEVNAAREAHIPIVPRAVMLAELMRFKQGIAIAGTHGKTTTTSLVASIFAQAGLDPTFVIGGRLNSAGTNARLGSGDHIIVEADESDASFLNLLPMIAVVTNIDEDHMSTYGHSRAQLDDAFVAFLHRMPFYGQAVMCIDDAGVRAVLPRVERPVVTYGFDALADVRAVDVQAKNGTMQFSVQRKDQADQDFTLNLAGEHNVRNALAAIAIAGLLQIDGQAVADSLAQFKGVGRRFQLAGQAATEDGGLVSIIDDYGHHPVEMAATLAAARGAYPGKRLILAFQPHRFSRTRDCFEDFVQVLGTADLVLLTDVYAAGEAPIVAADAKSLARAVRIQGRAEPIYVARVDDLPSEILRVARDGDVVLCMGAGSIAAVAANAVALAPARTGAEAT